MPIQNKKSAALLSRSEDVTPEHSSVRRGDEKRGSSDSRLEAYANKIRPEPAKKPIIDRRRKRLTTADVSVPKQQINMNKQG